MQTLPYWAALALMVAGFGLLLWRRHRLAPRLEVTEATVQLWQRPGVRAAEVLLREVPRAAVRAVGLREVKLDALRTRWQVRLLLVGGETLAVGSATAREAVARRPAEALAAALQVELTLGA